MIIWSTSQENTIISCTKDAQEVLDLCLLKLQVTKINDIFLYFLLVNEMIKAMIYNASMPGDQNHSKEIPTQRGKEAKMLKDP
jgi:hypothetical protein